jgi:aspartate/methionine/tyrosine aminotransferase
MVLFYLARRIRHSTGRAPRCLVPTPEYPPLLDAARAAGFRPVTAENPADVAVYSDPNNPSGLSPGESGRRRLARGCSTSVVDETFREFTTTPSITRHGAPGAWVCRSFTKVYGADDLRVGYVVAPGREAERFDSFQSVVLDGLPRYSLAAVRALLRDRARILAETRARFRNNLRSLRTAIPSVPQLAAPVWFDRGSGRSDGDRFARRALKSGVLVCPGRYFGDPSGVRVCLTQRSFPQDLAAYLRVRDDWF